MIISESTADLERILNEAVYLQNCCLGSGAEYRGAVMQEQHGIRLDRGAGIKFIAPVIQPFGYNLGDHLYPAIEYYTIPGAPVRAVTKGVVDTIITNSVIDGGDFQIRVISLPGSAYTVIYDHILNYKVQQKSLVYPGDTIGEAGYPTTTTRRTSLQVNYVDGTNTRAYCPLNFGDTSFVQQHRGLIAQYNALNFQPPYDSICISGPIIPQ